MSTIRRAAGVTLPGIFIAFLWQSEPATAQVQDEASSWDAIKKCASIADEGDRHRCADDVLRKAGLLGAAAGAAQPQTVTGAGVSRAEPSVAASAPETEQTAAAVAPPRRTPPKRYKEKPDKTQDPEKFDVTVAEAVRTGDGKLNVTTTEGEIWRQLYTDSSLPMPSAGQIMKVKRNNLGGFMCRVEKWPTFRCRPDA